MAFGDNPIRFRGVESSSLFGNGFTAIRSLMDEYATDGKLEDLARIVRAISVRDRSRVVATVLAELRGEASLLTEDKLSITGEDAPMGVAMSWKVGGDTGGVELVWRDSSGRRLRAKLNQIVEPEGLRFRLTTDLKFDDDR